MAIIGGTLQQRMLTCVLNDKRVNRNAALLMMSANGSGIRTAKSKQNHTTHENMSCAHGFAFVTPEYSNHQRSTKETLLHKVFKKSNANDEAY
jgi:hypothetical protein